MMPVTVMMHKASSVSLDSGHSSGVQFDRYKCQCCRLLDRLEVVQMVPVHGC